MEQQLKTDKAEMNKIYQRVYQQYDAQNKVLLEKSQKAWLNYRNTQCTELTGSLYYGAMGLASGFAHLDCEINTTQYRLKELTSLLEDQ
ncbi:MULTISPECIES: lysozyme inhibitor LprI family protein [unclassified Acinetobacter]|uniref:lysozyme inhibitor LprI family protein n=1 Tax=Acinetobacter TaxID=469 RepID=UPI001D0E634E|nr:MULTISPECIES: lysozyme inhibitor LprI family protein [unclassified Acinetobacter]